jgi:hypothetical protein
LHYGQRVKSRRDIVEHDSYAFGKVLQLSHRGRLDDVKDSKKYKTGKKSFPCERDSDQCNHLARDFVNHDELRIFGLCSAGHAGCGRNSHKRDQGGKCDGEGRSQYRAQL